MLARSFAFLQFDFLDSHNLTTDTGIVSPFSARFHSSRNFTFVCIVKFDTCTLFGYCLVSFCFLQTGGQYYDEEQRHLGVPPLYLQQFNHSQYCYDATWTLAYALNQTINGNVSINYGCMHANQHYSRRECLSNLISLPQIFLQS